MPDHILHGSPATPFVPQSGAQRRTALLYKALRTLGTIDLLLLEPSGKSCLASSGNGIHAQGFRQQRPLWIQVAFDVLFGKTVHYTKPPLVAALRTLIRRIKKTDENENRI